MKKRFIFMASTRWSPSLNKLEVLKETAKMFKIGEEINILGSRTWRGQVHKENDRWFDDPIKAIEYLIAEQAKVIKHFEIRLDDAHDESDLLKELLKELEKGDSDVVDVVSKALSP